VATHVIPVCSTSEMFSVYSFLPEFIFVPSHDVYDKGANCIAISMHLDNTSLIIIGKEVFQYYQVVKILVPFYLCSCVIRSDHILCVTPYVIWSCRVPEYSNLSQNGVKLHDVMMLKHVLAWLGVELDMSHLGPNLIACF
jgi:hypothetical protein